MILIVNNNQIQIIPFDWFNEKGGDYGYVWPAVAQIDIKNWRLFGAGMRMNDFEIKLEKSL